MGEGSPFPCFIKLKILRKDWTFRMITYVKRSNADKYSNLYETATQALMTHTLDGEVCEVGDEL